MSNKRKKEGSPPVKVIITCFGAFGGIPSNPTLSIVKTSTPNISTLLTSHPCPNTILKTFSLNVSSKSVSSQMSSIFISDILPHPGPVLLLHTGVDGTQKPPGKFKLERLAYNETDFRIPDNDGYQPSHLPISSSFGPKESYLCSMSLPSSTSPSSRKVDSVLNKLREKGWDDLVIPSDDAGRFVCNYTLFTSLLKAKEVYERREGEVWAGFLHVPGFELVEEEVQVRFLRDCVMAMVEEIEGREGGEYMGPP
ncbi:hypothetical protein TrVE_jg4389 [Triparma verrucosa]|uniref:Uncharacterized protein n=1 Tax=Triparma verrucosa TaxID=1606542 RepID=A0A9W7FD99_9STRA|nr:hypothetical protein TrVE_jg4389 [Triparma verrucosa]